MRIISQCGTLDLPYERIVISLENSGNKLHLTKGAEHEQREFTEWRNAESCRRMYADRVNRC